MEEVQEESKPMKNWVIALLNFLAMFVYDWFNILLGGKDSMSKFLIVTHLTICIGIALYTKKDGWWYSAIIVGMLVLFLFSH